MSSEHSLYEQYQLKQVINASGRMTILGVSTPREEVAAVVNTGLNHFFEMKDLVNKTGAYIARLLNVESAVVVSCASAGIAQSVAAVIVKDNAWLLENLHAAPLEVPHDIVLPKGHNVNFGAPVATMVTMGGGKVVEAGYANECSAAQLAACITPRTAAMAAATTTASPRRLRYSPQCCRRSAPCSATKAATPRTAPCCTRTRPRSRRPPMFT